MLAQERITQLEAQVVERDATQARMELENARLVEREKSSREAKTALEKSVSRLKVCVELIPIFCSFVGLIVNLKEEAETSRAALAAQVRELSATNAELNDAQEELVGNVQSLKSSLAILERKAGLCSPRIRPNLNVNLFASCLQPRRSYMPLRHRSRLAKTSPQHFALS